MNRFISLAAAGLLLVGPCLAPAQADSPLAKSGSDLGDKTRLLRTDHSQEIARLRADIVRLSRQIQGLDTQSQAAKSPTETAHLDQETARLGRLLAQDCMTMLALATSRQRQEEIRAGRPFPGTKIVPLSPHAQVTL